MTMDNGTTPPPSPVLSRPHADLGTRYDVVVVGSGYGGAIAAARFARAGRSVCVLERGRELRAGDFPSTGWRALRQLQVHRRGRRLFGRPDGLFDLRAGDDLSVLVGCGLGGTSLINAGVALRPPAWVYDDDRWPGPLRGARGEAELRPYFEEAERMLGSTSLPGSARVPTKLAALERVASGMERSLADGGVVTPVRVERPPINVTFADGPNAAGVEQVACNWCGDCVTGCNHRSKNTVAENYLPDAVAHGAHVFCEARVRAVETAAPGSEGRWTVSFDIDADGRPRFGAPASFVFADVVVLAAGTLGSTEILLRSRARGLAVSPRLGDRFTGNGDVLAFAHDVGGAPPLRGIGTGRRTPTPETEVGPCITGMIDLTETAPVGRRALVEEGSVPGALRPFMPAAFAVAADIDDGGSPLAFGRRLARRLTATGGAVLDPTGGPAERSLTYLAMTDDVGDGRLRLGDGGIRVDWPAVGDLPVFDRTAELLRAGADGLDAEYVANPIWSPMLDESLVTVHPLGGCAMADDGGHGVVDDRGRVFAGEGDEVHEGLLVTDGAIVPRPLAVNPLLTISALAERAVALEARDRRWSVRETPTPPLPAPPDGARPALRFTERMAGWAGPTAHGDPADGAARGEADGSRIEFVLTIDIDDLPAMLADAATPARLSGTVVAPVLSPRRLRVVDGTFCLAVEDPTHVDTWTMRYSMRLVADDGRRFRFEGHKVLHDRAGLDLWADTTTLHVTLLAGDGDDAVPVAGGIMRIAPGDLARQVATMAVHGVDGRVARSVWLLRFLKRFARTLEHVYGSIDDVARFPAGPARPVPLGSRPGGRHLCLGAPEPRWCDGDGRWHEGNEIGPDGWLRLVRYEGGRRGPVLLAAGFGMSATSFLVDTVPTNLAEHLFAAGYDVWLFDYRASIDLPSSQSSFTLDDIARRDWVEAVAEVRRVTGAASVQAVGHCVGSVSLMMALAAGLRDVRSAVCMQFTLHPTTSPLNLFKANIGVDRLMQQIGVRRVAPSHGASVPNIGLHLLLRGVPTPRGERCGKALCRWINAIYGCTHTHEQLNDATHERLDDLFGVGDVTALGHMGTIMQRRLAVDAAGDPVYTRHPERLRVPMLLVQGEKNYIFRPAGSMRTLRWLQSANEASLYERVVLPGYAHLDALIGRDAATDVYPLLTEHLNRFNH